MEVRDLEHHGRVQGPELPFRVTVNIISLAQPAVARLGDDIAALGGVMTHNVAPPSKESKADLDTLFAIHTDIPFDKDRIKIVDELRIDFDAKNARALENFMHRLQAVVPADVYARVDFGFREELTPSAGLIAMLETQRQRQGMTGYDILRGHGYTKFFENAGEPIRFLDRSLPNGLHLNTYLSKQGDAHPTHSMLASCVLKTFNNRSYEPYTDLHGSQMVRVLEKTHAKLMDAQNRDQGPAL